MGHQDNAYEDGAAELHRWYAFTQKADRGMALSKREEYGSADLRIMAGAMAEFLPEPSPEALGVAYPHLSTADALEAHYTEAAISFYTLGKVARVVGALSEGRVPSIDSWRDITVYSMMARRVRQEGSW